MILKHAFWLKKGTLDREIKAQFGMFIFDWLSEDFTGTCIKRPKPSSSSIP